MVFFKLTTLALGASLLAELVSASPAATHIGLARRDRRLALRQAGGAEAYPTETPAVCSSSLDTTNADGSCQCGPGRTQVTPTTCTIASDETGSFSTFTLNGPVELSYPVTVSNSVIAPSEILTPRQCAAICATDGQCLSFYIQAGAVSGTNECWKIGASGAYLDPRDTGIPFTASGSTKRAEGVRGSIGQAGGILGISDVANPDGSSGTCTAGVDTRNLDGTCSCGAGRVNDTDADTGCVSSPSAAARLRQRRRESFEGVQW